MQPAWGNTLQTLAAIENRWKRYEQDCIDQEISAVDDMLPSEQSREEYFGVGRSALHVISEAMFLSGRTDFNHVLDLPCGGGRVTRHLVKFFPESRIFVDDIVVEKREAVRDQFSVEIKTFPRNFKGSASPFFDLIFVGSLFTHLNETMFVDALDYLIRSLNPEGLLIVTTHGRAASTWAAADQRRLRKSRPKRSLLDRIRPASASVPIENVLEAIEGKYVSEGFGYTESRSVSDALGESYGATFVTPA